MSSGAVMENKVFQPEIETVEEFIERFKVMNHDKLRIKNEAGVVQSVSEEHKAMLFANCLPVNVITDIQRRLKPTLLSNAKYAELETHLISLFSTKKSVIGASVAFLTRKQQPGESIEGYAKVLNELASQCSYEEECRKRVLRDAFVTGLRSAKIMTALIQLGENKTFHEVLDRAKTIEQCTQDVEDINPTAKVSNQFHIDGEHKFKNKSYNGASQKVSTNYNCYRCNQKGKHFQSDCWARKIQCNVCANVGHSAKACRTKNSKKEVKKISHSNKSTSNKFNHVDKPEEEFDPAKYFYIENVRKGNKIDSVASLDTVFPDIEVSSNYDFEMCPPAKANQRSGNKLVRHVRNGAGSNQRCSNSFEALYNLSGTDIASAHGDPC